jgi:hypothetical protein
MARANTCARAAWCTTADGKTTRATVSVRSHWHPLLRLLLRMSWRCCAFSHTSPSGTCSYSNGDVYKGKWRSNQKHGDGSYLFHNGNMYRGEWANDRACGTGTCVYSNGDKYTGSWLQDRAHGKGVFTPLPLAYEPFIRVELIHNLGKGVYTYSGGELYDGDWVHGKKTGQGVRYSSETYHECL